MGAEETLTSLERRWPGLGKSWEKRAEVLVKNIKKPKDDISET